MKQDYTGIIVEESLDDMMLVNMFNVVGVKIGSTNKWHCYTVKMSVVELDKLRSHLKPRWFFHCWKDKDMVVMFKDETFAVSKTDRKTWKPAIDYGRSLGIPSEQLDFPTK